jgi:hypothetical protein|eukprot:6344151-Prymnesium_polylepis.2
MCNVDLPTQLHFALFSGSGGFVLKPREMRAKPADAQVYVEGSPELECWPKPCEWLHRVSMEVVSLHNCPKVSLRMPRVLDCYLHVHSLVRHNTKMHSLSAPLPTL